MLRRGRGRKCRLQFSLPRRYECVNCRAPLLGLRFAATSRRASHAYPCLLLLDTDTGNCRETCPTITHPAPLPHLPSAGGAENHRSERRQAPEQTVILLITCTASLLLRPAAPDVSGGYLEVWRWRNTGLLLFELGNYPATRAWPHPSNLRCEAACGSPSLFTSGTGGQCLQERSGPAGTTRPSRTTSDPPRCSLLEQEAAAQKLYRKDPQGNGKIAFSQPAPVAKARCCSYGQRFVDDTSHTRSKKQRGLHTLTLTKICAESRHEWRLPRQQDLQDGLDRPERQDTSRRT